MSALLTLFDGDTFSPRRLFLSSTIGAIYDYDDFSYLYQKSDGSVPVTALEQPVGFLQDKRWGGAVGSELVTNGDFSTTTNWSLLAGAAISGGLLTLDNQANSRAERTGSPLTSNRTYCIEVNVTANSGGFNIVVYDAGGAATIQGPILSGTGLKRFYMHVGATNGNFRIIRSSGSQVISFISVRELPGLHAYQSTDAARPVLKGTPRYTLFDRTDDHWIAATGGGGTTGFMLAGSIQPATDGVARTIFSDRGTNTGYKVEINAANALIFTAGNGAAYTTCTGPTLTAGTNYAFCVWHDGANLNIKVGTAATVSQAFATATAGTSTLTLFKDNAAASGYFSGRLYALTYIRNASITEGTASQLIGWAASKGGFAL